jgi:two-component system, sensor histidine kinase and response regulator
LFDKINDDDPNNFEVIETLLAGDNYDLYYANSGEEALTHISTFNPDVILLDLTMPKMDGLEVCGNGNNCRLSW